MRYQFIPIQNRSFTSTAVDLSYRYRLMPMPRGDYSEIR